MVTLLLSVALSAQNSNDADYQAAFDQGFRMTFRQRSVEGCVASAKNAAAAKIDTTPICTCVADKLLATKTVTQLRGKLTDAEMDSIVAQCIVERPPVAGAKYP